MKLYIPLFGTEISKAVQIPNAGMDSSSERKTALNHKESFTRVSPGVSGDSAAPDRPEVGAKWAHDEESSVDEDVEKERNANKDLNDKRGVTKAPKKVEKSSEALEIMKSFNSELKDELRFVKLNPLEVEFLKSHFDGCTDDDINKGRVSITGRHRSAFTDWLNERLVRNSSNIYRR